jgi:hypothetical protein
MATLILNLKSFIYILTVMASIYLFVDYKTVQPVDSVHSRMLVGSRKRNVKEFGKRRLWHNLMYYTRTDIVTGQPLAISVRTCSMARDHFPEQNSEKKCRRLEIDGWMVGRDLFRLVIWAYNKLTN